MPVYGLAVILAITGGIAGALLFQRWANQAGAARVRHLLRNAAIVAVGLLLLFLLVRAGPALLAFAAVLLPIVARVFNLWSRLNSIFNVVNGFNNRTNRTRFTDSSQSSITTRFLEVNLDHASGEMQGKIIDGRFTGRTLEQLTFNELLELWRECQVDAQSSAILEAYLDRTQDRDWRERATAEEGSKYNDDKSPIDKEDAYAILGLKPGATEDEIKAAHRRLMQKVHPDHGGSDYLAARINEAKDFLLSK